MGDLKNRGRDAARLLNCDDRALTGFHPPCERLAALSDYHLASDAAPDPRGGIDAEARMLIESMVKVYGAAMNSR